MQYFKNLFIRKEARTAADVKYAERVNDARLLFLEKEATSRKVQEGRLDLSKCGLKKWIKRDGQEIRELCLAFNRMQQIPEDIAFELLTWLDLRHNHLHSGEQRAISPHTTFSNLKVLLLARNLLEAADVNLLVTNTPRLKVLDVSFNPLNCFPSSIRACKGLALLDLTHTHLEEVDWAVVVSLRNLQVLKLGDNRISMVDPALFSLPHLSALVLESNSISELRLPDASPPAPLSPLSILNLNRLLLTSLSSSFSSFSNLKVLTIQCSNMKVFPEEVCSMQLRCLRISGAKFKDVPVNLANMAVTLRELVLRFNELEVVPVAVTMLRHLRVLDLAGNDLCHLRVEGAEKDWLRHFHQLRSLSLAFNNFSHHGDICANELLHLSTAHQLRYISLAGNPLVGDINITRSVRFPEPSSSPASSSSPSASEVLSSSMCRQLEYGCVESFLLGIVSASPVASPGAPSLSSPPSLSSSPSSSSLPSGPRAEDLRDAIFGLVVGCALGDAVGLSTEFTQRYQAFIHYHAAQPLWSDADDVNGDDGNDGNDGDGNDGNDGDGNHEPSPSSQAAARRAAAYVAASVEDLGRGREWLQDSHRSRWVRGDWTDDTDQVLLILDSIVAHDGEVQAEDFSCRLFTWAREGMAELGDGGGMGIGSTVGSVLRNPLFLPPVGSRRGWHAHSAARDVWNRNPEGAANGSVMRAAVCGVPFYWDTEKVASQTQAIAGTTHVDPRTMVSCLTVTNLVSKLLSAAEKRGCGGSANYDEFSETTDKMVNASVQFALSCLPQLNGPSRLPLSVKYRDEFVWFAGQRSLKELDLGEQKAIGYCFKALGAGLWALRQPSGDFAQAIQAILMEAGDADTNAAVAGALLGARIGFKSLPASWLHSLPHRDIILARCDALYETVVRQRQRQHAISS